MNLNSYIRFVIAAVLIGLGYVGRSLATDNDEVYLLFSIVQGAGQALLAYYVGGDIIRTIGRKL